MLFMRVAGGLESVCVWRGGVGSCRGRLADAALGRRAEGSQDKREAGGELEGDGRLVDGGCERRLRRCMASLEAFSRM
jgi:hypothetical protein